MANIKSTDWFTVTALASIALFALGWYGCTANPNPVAPPPVVPERQPAPPPVDQGPRSLTVYVDKTQSSSTDALREFSSMLEAAIAAAENLIEIVVVNVGLDGKGSWNAPAQKFVLPSKPSDNYASELAALKEAIDKNCGGRVNCELRERQAAEEQLNARVAEEMREYELARARVVESVVLAVLQTPKTEPPCTNLTEMAERIVHTPSTHVIWLTDGEHSCNTPLTSQPFRNKVLLGVLPLTNEADGEFGKRLSLLQQTFTAAAEIEPVSALDSRAVITFLRS